MKTIKEKADEIYNKHYIVASEYCEEIQCSLIAKQCALISIDEIIEFMKLDDEMSDTCHNANSIFVKYYLDIKRQIELK